MQYHSKILKIVKVTKKNVNRLVFFGHPLYCYILKELNWVLIIQAKYLIYFDNNRVKDI